MTSSKLKRVVFFLKDGLRLRERRCKRFLLFATVETKVAGGPVLRRKQPSCVEEKRAIKLAEQRKKRSSPSPSDDQRALKAWRRCDYGSDRRERVPLCFAGVFVSSLLSTSLALSGASSCKYFALGGAGRGYFWLLARVSVVFPCLKLGVFVGVQLQYALYALST